MHPIEQIPNVQPRTKSHKVKGQGLMPYFFIPVWWCMELHELAMLCCLQEASMLGLINPEKTMSVSIESICGLCKAEVKLFFSEIRLAMSGIHQVEVRRTDKFWLHHGEPVKNANPIRVVFDVDTKSYYSTDSEN